MAIKLGGDDDELAEAHEINVTPFIDVMLVLLIIFLVAAPLAPAPTPQSPLLCWSMLRISWWW